MDMDTISIDFYIGGSHLYRFHRPGPHFYRLLQTRMQFLNIFTDPDQIPAAVSCGFQDFHGFPCIPVKTMSAGRRNTGMGKGAEIQQPPVFPRHREDSQS